MHFSRWSVGLICLNCSKRTSSHWYCISACSLMPLTPPTYIRIAILLGATKARSHLHTIKKCLPLSLARFTWPTKQKKGKYVKYS